MYVELSMQCLSSDHIFARRRAVQSAVYATGRLCAPWAYAIDLRSLLAESNLFIIIYTVYAHVKSFTTMKNRKCGQVTSHCRKARPYRADLNVPVVTVKSEITV